MRVYIKLAPKEGKRRHINLGKIVHWKLVKKCAFEVKDKWYEDEPEIVLDISYEMEFQYSN